MPPILNMPRIVAEITTRDEVEHRDQINQFAREAVLRLSASRLEVLSSIMAALQSEWQKLCLRACARKVTLSIRSRKWECIFAGLRAKQLSPAG